MHAHFLPGEQDVCFFLLEVSTGGPRWVTEAGVRRQVVTKSLATQCMEAGHELAFREKKTPQTFHVTYPASAPRTPAGHTLIVKVETIRLFLKKM